MNLETNPDPFLGSSGPSGWPWLTSPPPPRTMLHSHQSAPTTPTPKTWLMSFPLPGRFWLHPTHPGRKLCTMNFWATFGSQLHPKPPRQQGSLYSNPLAPHSCLLVMLPTVLPPFLPPFIPLLSSTEHLLQDRSGAQAQARSFKGLGLLVLTTRMCWGRCRCSSCSKERYMVLESPRHQALTGSEGLEQCPRGNNS